MVDERVLRMLLQLELDPVSAVLVSLWLPISDLRVGPRRHLLIGMRVERQLIRDSPAVEILAFALNPDLVSVLPAVL